MRSLISFGLLVAGVEEVNQRGGDVGITLKSLHPRVTSPEEFYRWDLSNRTSRATRFRREAMSPRYYETRKPEQCTFPLEIVILQDLTDSFSDNIEEMKNTQLKQMVNGLSATHPGTKFTVVGFQDKPIARLGNRDDACWTFNGDFTSDFESIYNTYAGFKTYGGYDAPENQFGAILAALDTTKINWGPINSEYARLIVVVTDAGPHHADDGAKPADGSILAPYSGIYSDEAAGKLCLETGYPSAQQMYDRIVAKQTYIAMLVFDGDWANGWAANEWRTFNNFLAQPAGFLEQDAEDSSLFWQKLSAIITRLENIECAPDQPTPTPQVIATTRTGVPLTSGAPVATTKPAVKPVEECNPTVIVDGPCVPAPENCHCHPDVLINLAKKPDSLNLVADDKVLAAW